MRTPSHLLSIPTSAAGPGPRGGFEARWRLALPALCAALLCAGCSLTGRGDVSAFDNGRDADLIAESRRASGLPPSRAFMLRTNAAQRDTFAAMLNQRQSTIINDLKWPVLGFLGFVALVSTAWLVDRMMSWRGKRKAACWQEKIHALVDGIKGQSVH